MGAVCTCEGGPERSSQELVQPELRDDAFLQVVAESKPAIQEVAGSSPLSDASTADISPKETKRAPAKTEQDAAGSSPLSDASTAAVSPKVDRIEAWRVRRAEVEQLVDQVRNYEAGLLLRDLDQDIEQAKANKHSSEFSSEELTFCQELQGTPGTVFASLRSFMGRLEKAVAEIAVPAQRTDVDWGEVHVEDPSICKDFSMTVKVRYKSAHEYDPKGGRSQFSARVEIRNLPMSLVRRIALEREVDLTVPLPGTMVDHLEGKIEGRSRLFCSYFHVISKAAMVPWKTDNVEVREFSKLKDPLLPGLRPDMFLMMATPALGDDLELAGFKIPPCRDGCTRTGIQFLRFVEPEGDAARCCFTILVQASVNIPSWLLPLYLVKQILSRAMKAMFKDVVGLVQRWPTLGYDERIGQVPEFYNAAQKAA
eukprot:TRINITY_DN11514_c0_g1_i1.p1 TRINITY_DN11514_c0_g1~~TRINITY_DN11514_c0_g1_i1.p1  ORF type:complete len:436 (-),score=80.00 TRINITY_DN11514_c0_g1_i1:261-1535(-)